MKNASLLLIALFGLTLFSCKDNKNLDSLEVVTVDNTPDSQKTYEVAKSEAVFKDSKKEAVFNQYLKVENALINTDAKAAAKEAKELSPLLEAISADEVVQKANTEIANSDDIAFQRQNFEYLSGGMEKIVEGALESGKLYKQYCPMAFNNRGAYWISSGKNILNPYFGDKMLKCGRVEFEFE